jgi:hypothetical protein
MLYKSRYPGPARGCQPPPLLVFACIRVLFDSSRLGRRFSFDFQDQLTVLIDNLAHSAHRYPHGYLLAWNYYTHSLNIKVMMLMRKR